MTFDNDTTQIIDDFGTVSACLITKGASAGSWDSAGSLLWSTSTATSFACQVQVMPSKRISQFRREESGAEKHEYVTIYMTDDISVSLDNLIQDKNNAEKTYKVVGITNRWTGHQEIDCIYVAGGIET